MASIFCSHCSTYHPFGAHCPACGQTRPLTHIPTAPGQTFWRVELPGGAGIRLALVRVERARSETGPSASLDSCGRSPDRATNTTALVVTWASARDAPSDGGVALLDASTGATLWARSVGLPVEGGAIVAGELLLVGAGQRGLGAQGALVALDSATGAERWRASLGGPVRAAPAADEACIYAVACDGVLTCLNLCDGAVIWSRPIAESAVTMAAAPVLVQEKGYTRAILAATYSRSRDRRGGLLVAFDARGQHLFPPVEVDGNIAATPVLMGQRVYLTAYADHPSRGLLAAYDARAGKRLWTFTCQAAPGDARAYGFRAAPCVHHDTVYVTSLDHHLYALDAETGDLRWQHDVGKGSACQPVWLRGLIIFGANDGNIYAVDAETGARAWAYHLGGRIFTTPQPFPQGVLVANDRGDVVALPWHLGQYAWAAERLERAGRFSEAGDCCALAAYYAHDSVTRDTVYLQAQANWQQAGELEKAGYVWSALDRRKDAAYAFQQAGEHWRHKDACRAAGYFKRAADLYFDLRQAAPLSVCTRALSRCAPLPHLRVEPTGTGFIQWEASRFTLRLLNEGQQPAANVRLCLLGGALQEPLEAALKGVLAPGESWNIPLTVTPTLAESVLLVEVTYASDEAAYNPLHALLEVPIRAAERPRPAVQIGDVGLLRMEIAGTTEEGVTINTQDVGYLRNGA